MKKILFYLQLAAVGLILVGVAGMGVILFQRGAMTGLTPLYVFAGLGLVGFIGNAALAVARIYLEMAGRK